MWELILAAALFGQGRSEALCNDAYNRAQCEQDIAVTMYLNYCDHIEYRDEACALLPPQGLDDDWLQNREAEIYYAKYHSEYRR